MSPGGQTDKDQVQRAFNLTLATVAGQVGCLTFVIVIAALIAGLWLDAQFHTRPLFTLLLMLASVPVTIMVMYRVATAATAGIKPVGAGQGAERDRDKEERDRQEEGANGGTNP